MKIEDITNNIAFNNQMSFITLPYVTLYTGIKTFIL